MLRAILLTLANQLEQTFVRTSLDEYFGEVEVSAADVLVQAELIGHVEAAEELVAAGAIALQELHRTKRIQRVKQGLAVVETLAELDCAPGGRDPALDLPMVQVEHDDAGICGCELARRRQTLEKLYRALDWRTRFGPPHATDVEAGHPAQAVGLVQDVACLPEDLHGLFLRLDRLVRVAHMQRLVRVPLKKLRVL